MTLVSFIVVFALCWWIILYMMLPVGINKNVDNIELGYCSGAPDKPCMGRKILFTTLLSLIITPAIIFLINNGYFSAIAESMQIYP